MLSHVHLLSGGVRRLEAAERRDAPASLRGVEGRAFSPLPRRAATRLIVKPDPSAILVLDANVIAAGVRVT